MSERHVTKPTPHAHVAPTPKADKPADLQALFKLEHEFLARIGTECGDLNVRSEAIELHARTQAAMDGKPYLDWKKGAPDRAQHAGKQPVETQHHIGSSHK